MHVATAGLVDTERRVSTVVKFMFKRKVYTAVIEKNQALAMQTKDQLQLCPYT